MEVSRIVSEFLSFSKYFSESRHFRMHLAAGTSSTGFSLARQAIDSANWDDLGKSETSQLQTASKEQEVLHKELTDGNNKTRLS